MQSVFGIFPTIDISYADQLELGVGTNIFTQIVQHGEDVLVALNPSGKMFYMKPQGSWSELNIEKDPILQRLESFDNRIYVISNDTLYMLPEGSLGMQNPIKLETVTTPNKVLGFAAEKDNAILLTEDHKLFVKDASNWYEIAINGYDGKLDFIGSSQGHLWGVQKSDNTPVQITVTTSCMTYSTVKSFPEFRVADNQWIIDDLGFFIIKGNKIHKYSPSRTFEAISKKIEVVSDKSPLISVATCNPPPTTR